jgi:hypothetical protein
LQRGTSRVSDFVFVSRRCGKKTLSLQPTQNFTDSAERGHSSTAGFVFAYFVAQLVRINRAAVVRDYLQIVFFRCGHNVFGNFYSISFSSSRRKAASRSNGASKNIRILQTIFFRFQRSYFTLNECRTSHCTEARNSYFVMNVVFET